MYKYVIIDSDGNRISDCDEFESVEEALDYLDFQIESREYRESLSVDRIEVDDV